MAGLNVGILPDQATAPSPSRVKMHAPAYTTEQPFVQRAETTHIFKDASKGPSSETEQTHFDVYGAHTGDLAENVGQLEESRKQCATKHSSSLVQNSCDMITLQHRDPSSLLEASAPAPAQNPTTTPLILTYETNKENASMQQPSKEIVKVTTSEDDMKKLVSVESTKVLPCVGAFTVQCALCMKWRLIPTKDQYEEIRQSVLETPFFCSSAAGWRPDVSCEDPSDVLQDESHLWAIDRPNIPVAPSGWERQIVFRGVGASKFADVYYVAPSGRKLRSMPEVERFLAEFPEYLRAGVKHSQFSFIIPRPLDSNYCRKKTAGPSSVNTTSTNKSKQPQVKKLSVKRRAFESLLSKEGDADELDDGRKKWSGGGLLAEKFEKGSGYDVSISQQVVQGSLPPEELMKGLFWPRSSNPEHASALGTLKPPTTVNQSEHS